MAIIKYFLLIMTIIILSCSAAVTVKKTPSLTCYDHESCRRSCFSYDNKEDCKQLQYYK